MSTLTSRSILIGTQPTNARALSSFTSHQAAYLNTTANVPNILGNLLNTCANFAARARATGNDTTMPSNSSSTSNNTDTNTDDKNACEDTNDTKAPNIHKQQRATDTLAAARTANHITKSLTRKHNILIMPQPWMGELANPDKLVAHPNYIMHDAHATRTHRAAGRVYMLERIDIDTSPDLATLHNP